MKLKLYAIAFVAAAAIGTQAEPAHYTMTNGCVSVTVPVSLFQQAVNDGLYAWMDAQCGVQS